MLKSNSDVHVLFSRHAKFNDVVSFENSSHTTRFSYYLKKFISNTVFYDQWHLIVDADEFLILPPPIRSITDYSEVLESAGMSYCFAPMIDFYPRTLRERNFPMYLPPLMGSPYFDSGRYRRLDRDTGKITCINNGIRERILAYLARNAASHLSALQLRASDLKRPVNYKFPLLRTSIDITSRGVHWISKIHSIEKSATLVHFKYCHELDTKLASSLEEGQYHNNSMQYRLLKVALDTINDVDLVFEKSVKFTSSEDLVRANVMHSLQTGAV
jgi:hypothetical protein